MDTQHFYDGLAATYHALYLDWERPITDPADALRELLGLAALGYRMFASDLSPRAVDRAVRDRRQRGLEASLRVSDMRSLPWDDDSMDAVVCPDNALPTC